MTVPAVRAWTTADDAVMRSRYPDTPTRVLAEQLGRALCATYQRAQYLGLKKSAEYLGSPAACRLAYGAVGVATRYQKGHVPANKGMRRPGWATGRMRETQFRKGQYPAARWDPELYAVGALRMNPDGYVDMKVKEGPRAWKQFHRILWEDAHGPVPKSCCIVFKDGDKLNLDVDNLELVPRVEIMRRNSIHNLPEPLRETIRALGHLKRRLNEKQDS